MSEINLEHHMQHNETVLGETHSSKPQTHAHPSFIKVSAIFQILNCADERSNISLELQFWIAVLHLVLDYRVKNKNAYQHCVVLNFFGHAKFEVKIFSLY